MIAAALLLLAAQADAPAPPTQPAPQQAPSNAQTPPAPGTPPRPRAIEWDALPPIPYRTAPRLSDPMVAFVRGEVAAGRCPMPPIAPDGRALLRADVAVLVAPSGEVRVTIPRAIACPSVEQYAAGLVVGFARRHLNPRAVRAGGWFRATLVFDWPA